MPSILRDRETSEFTPYQIFQANVADPSMRSWLLFLILQ
jgi:hypothetical protein